MSKRFSIAGFIAESYQMFYMSTCYHSTGQLSRYESKYFRRVNQYRPYRKCYRRMKHKEPQKQCHHKETYEKQYVTLYYYLHFFGGLNNKRETTCQRISFDYLNLHYLSCIMYRIVILFINIIISG